GERGGGGAGGAREGRVRGGGGAGLSRVVEPAEHLALPALWLRGDRRDPDRCGARRHADAPATARHDDCSVRLRRSLLSDFRGKRSWYRLSAKPRISLKLIVRSAVAWHMRGAFSLTRCSSE